MPKARYTTGPDELTFGHPQEVLFTRGVWREVAAADVAQLTLPARVAEYGFEIDADAAAKPAAQASPTSTPDPAA